MSFCDIAIGHATDQEFHTGCTVFLCPERTVGSVDIRGLAPGSREAALLAPDKQVGQVNAVVLSGGSAFGLATADGVMQYLAENGVGFPTPVRPVPIVPAAIVYDFHFSRGQRTPDAAMGYKACMAAGEEPIAQGNVGVGAGTTVGKWGGISAAMKGGFGIATAQENQLMVCAAAAVNCVGDVLNEDGSVLAGARVMNSKTSDRRWLVEMDPYRRFHMTQASWGTNTTLLVVATNASLDKVSVNRLAQRAQDGLAIAVRPAHTTRDGDTAFALATGKVEVSFDLVANVAVAVVAEAIRNGVRHAATIGEIEGLAG